MNGPVGGGRSCESTGGSESRPGTTPVGWAPPTNSGGKHGGRCPPYFLKKPRFRLPLRVGERGTDCSTALTFRPRLQDDLLYANVRRLDNATPRADSQHHARALESGP